MKAVLMAFSPEECEKIFNGKITLDVRKIAPKLEPPFKEYVYCTKARHKPNDWMYHLPNDRTLYFGANARDVSFVREEGDFRNGMVIGEFVCDKTIELPCETTQPHWLKEKTCLSDDEYMQYLGHKDGKGLYIAKPKRYDTLKELSEFVSCKHYNGNECTLPNTIGCAYREPDLNPDGSVNIFECKKRVTRPPQSWMYVEEIEE